MSDLDFASLPSCAQHDLIVSTSNRIWLSQDAVAIWLGGSIASRCADAYSDVDIRVAVVDGAFMAWQEPANRFLPQAYLVHQYLRFSEGHALHHYLLHNGDMLDIDVQTVTTSLRPEPNIVLACRDKQLAKRLKLANQPIVQIETNINPAEVLLDLRSYWLTSYKHIKVLSRGLDLVVQQGIHAERKLLLRLWYQLATDKDPGLQHTIHGLTRVTALARRCFPDRCYLLGTPLNSREEIVTAIEELRNEISRLGRQLAEKHGFEYPEHLEELVRGKWSEFLVGSISQRS